MCGIIGIIGPEQSETRGMPHWAAYEICRSLLALQHRGQDAAGILSFDNGSRMFLQEKDLGLVTQVFDRQKIEKLTGPMAIGHTRYATAGTDGRRDIQPMVTGIPFGLGMVHNGNILNYHSLTKELAEKYRRQMLTANDLEVLIHYFGCFLLENSGGVPDKDTFRFENIRKAASRLFDTVVGGYAVLGLIAGQGLVALRDPKGIRPLMIGVREAAGGGKAHCLASETIALTCLGYDYLRDVAPGEVIFIDAAGRMQSAVVHEEKEKAPCMFEWVYFSGAESSIDNQSVYTVRLKLGERLGLKAQRAIRAGEISPDVVMPVPDTSRPAAISVAAMLGLPYREGLIKNRYIARSFIMNSQEKRDAAVELKLSPILSEIEGKNIFLIDDSIVRGTTSRKIVAMLKKYGAREVAVGVTCPPMRYPCYYGIDFPDPSTLIANDKSVEDIALWLDAKKVIYLDEEDLRLATGHSSLCMACVNNKYPTEVTEGDHFSRERKKARACG
ncbi:MAG: amidophosphoribosyltransferase [Pseudomonadota bacterium]